MSAESFIAAYSSHPDLFVSMVNERRQKESKNGQAVHSPVVHLADLLIESGKDGYKEVKVWEPQQGSTAYTKTLIEKRTADFASILVGSIVLSMEDCLRDGEHDFTEFIARLNRGFSNTPYSYFIRNNRVNSVEQFTFGDMQEMTAAAKFDPTLSIFLEIGDFRPKYINGFVEEVFALDKAIGERYDFVTWQYRKLAQGVVMKEKPKTILPRKLRKNLRSIDFSSLDFTS